MTDTTPEAREVARDFMLTHWPSWEADAGYVQRALERLLATQAAEVERLRAFAQSYVDAYEAGTGTVYLIDAARAALRGDAV